MIPLIEKFIAGEPVLFQEGVIDFERAFDKETFEEYVAIQYIDGKKFFKLQPKYFEDLGRDFKNDPENLCRIIWESVICGLEYKSILDFVTTLFSLSFFIKKITDSKVDFCEIMLKELKKNA